ncbi:MAG: DUF362 domain-containing protein [Candidatus Helarchaeota archaeon]
MIEIDREKCCGCNYCTLSCAQEALTYHEYQIIVDLDKCIFCGSCVYYCPNTAIRVSRKE